jgi:hypothetical protein
MARRKINRSVEEFTDETAGILRASIVAFELLAQGRLIVMIGCNYDGKVWALPNPSAPAKVVAEALAIDWSTAIPGIMEHCPQDY